MSEATIETTPLGGDRSEVVYLDAAGRVVDREDAQRAMISEWLGDTWLGETVLLREGSLTAAYDPEKHPRHPAGSKEGGRWRPKGASLDEGMALTLVGELRDPDTWSDYYDERTYEIVRERGRAFSDFRPIDSGERHATPQACFENCGTIALERDDLTYVEGYAYPEPDSMWMQIIGKPVHHAWMVDSEGRIYDPTWNNNGSAYVGVPVTSDYLFKELSRRKVWGIFGEGYASTRIKMPPPGAIVPIGRPI